MRRALPIFVAVLFAGCFKPPGDAPQPVDEGQPVGPPVTDAEARKVVEKAIAAHGGPEAVAKLRSMRIKAMGTANGAPFTIEDIWVMPDRYKSTSTFRANDQEIKQTQCIVGDTGWIQIGGALRDMPKEAVTEMKEQRYGEDFDRLDFLKNPEITLALSDFAVMKEPVSVVTVHSPGHRNVALSFSKKTGLLIKREHAVLDPATRTEVKQEVLFAYFEPKDGVMHYRKIMAYREGNQIIDARITEIEFLPKIDDKVFAKPEK